MRTAGPLGALLVLLVLLAGPAQGQGQGHGRAQGQALGDREAIAAVAERRAAAVRAGDRDGFMATVDPGADDGFRRSQAAHFDGLRAMPLEGYAVTVDDDDTGDLSPPGLADRRYGGAPVYLPATIERYRIRGYDDRDARDVHWITYVERDGEWFVGGDTDLDGVGLRTDRNLWDLGPVRLLPTEHFLIVGHPDTADRADDLARLAETAFQRHAALWDRRWSERIPIILPSSVDELEILIQATFDLDNFVAFVAYNIDDDAPSGYETTAPRMYIQDRNLSTYGDDFQIETLVHELVHAATAADAGPFVDHWVHEGVADWIALGRPLDAEAERSDGRIPDPHHFRTGGSSGINLAYAESASAVSFLAASVGEAAPADLFATLGATRRAPGSVDHHVGVALEQITGRGFAEFEKAWAGS